MDAINWISGRMTGNESREEAPPTPGEEGVGLGQLIGALAAGNDSVASPIIRRQPESENGVRNSTSTSNAVAGAQLEGNVELFGGVGDGQRPAGVDGSNGEDTDLENAEAAPKNDVSKMSLPQKPSRISKRKVAAKAPARKKKTRMNTPVSAVAAGNLVSPQPATSPKDGDLESNSDDSSVSSDEDDPNNRKVSPKGDETVVLVPVKKGRTAPAEAAAAAKQKSRQPAVKKGCRIKVRRSHICHLLPPHLQECLSRNHPNHHNCCGTVVSKTVGVKARHDLQLDAFRNNEIATGLRRNVFRTLPKNADEPMCDARYLAVHEREAEAADADAKDELEYKTEKEFSELPKEDLLAAESFTHQFKNKRIAPIVWKIHSPDDEISDCKVFSKLRKKRDEGPTISSELDFKKSNADFFLDHMWPSMEGFGKRLDEHCRDERSECCVTVKDRRLKFEDQDNDDPDWKVKQAVLSLIEGSVASGIGIDQCWRTGLSQPGLEAADFGKHFEKNEFRAIVAALPHMWCHKRDKPWDVFAPFVDAWNKKQQRLFDECDLALADESMIAWVPKTSKLGGLPNCTFEPRKPTPLGTMLKDTAEIKTGILLNTDPLMSPSIQDKKTFASKKSHSPEHAGTAASHLGHAAETLRQAHHSGLTEGSWLGGDAWFGSVASCLALKLEVVTHVDEDGVEHEHELGVESTFVVKNNVALHPRGPLHAALKARHGKRLAGHWVAMSTAIKGVPLIAVAHAWNNKDVSFVVSTCGETSCCQEPCVCHDPNTGCDNVDTKMHSRPDIVNFLFTQCPVIDVHNKLRQFGLAIEKQWPTKCCWAKLSFGYLGNSVVNQNRLFAHVHPGVPGKDLASLILLAQSPKTFLFAKGDICLLL